ncbi:MAG: S1C family serine protease [Bacilli bacterium]
MKKNWKIILCTVIITLVVSVLVALTTCLILKQNILKETESKQQTVVSKVESDIESVYEDVVNGVVYLDVATRYGETSGSGFIYKIENNSAYILTNYHVVEDATKIVITTNSGVDIKDIDYLGGDSLLDVAVLKVAATDEMIALPVKESSDYGVGETVLAIGSPLGKNFMNTATLGIISGKNRFLEVEEEGGMGLWLIQTDTAINPGNSGGPLFTMDGEVVGINSLKFVKDGVEGMGFAIPMETIISKLSAFENGDKIRPTYGFKFRESSFGVEVVEVFNNSIVKKAGLKSGDIITKVNGEDVENAKQLKEDLSNYFIGDKVTLTIERNDKQIELKLDL